MQKKEKNFFYCFDRYHNITYWSLTLFLLCLVVIISLEVGKPIFWSILCGILAILSFYIAYQQQLRLTDEVIEKRSVFPKKRWTYRYETIESISFYYNCCHFKLKDGTEKRVYIWKRELPRLKQSLLAKHLIVHEQ